MSFQENDIDFLRAHGIFCMCMFSLTMNMFIPLSILSENITCSICEQFSLSLPSGVICMCIRNKTRVFDIRVLFIQLETHTQIRVPVHTY